MSDVIDKTIEILERDGWCQGVWEKNDGTHCLSGALQVAVAGKVFPLWCDHPADFERYRQAKDAVKAVLVEHHPEVVAGIIGFNDKRGRTLDDILHVLKLAGERLDLEAER